ncbi:hypothetical protein [Kineosporia babensis]|uniref:Uncharacterized protein n=1 Tax=Kineosporia babensis TaxID=499548 RepID=A0A9X1NG96_9ACTN|nr:hypothetical protein [Kineosporia babensis]MCD5313261.1 hypothetical protein [Kineosporia babensis]
MIFSNGVGPFGVLPGMLIPIPGFSSDWSFDDSDPDDSQMCELLPEDTVAETFDGDVDYDDDSFAISERRCSWLIEDSDFFSGISTPGRLYADYKVLDSTGLSKDSAIQTIDEDIRRGDAQEVEGVGEKAAWETGTKTLTFVHDEHRYTIQLTNGERTQDERSAKAQELAKAIIANHEADGPPED